MKVLFVLTFLLFLPLPAGAEDPCAGRNPRFCPPAPAPVICGYERVKPRGSLATTHDYVCRQGDRVLFVRKGRQNHYNINDVRERDYEN